MKFQITKSVARCVVLTVALLFKEVIWRSITDARNRDSTTSLQIYRVDLKLE